MSLSLAEIRSRVYLTKNGQSGRFAFWLTDKFYALYRRRLAFYAVGSAIFAAIFILGSSLAANAATDSFANPASYIDDAIGNAQYLAYNRWAFANDLPSPTATMGQVSAMLPGFMRSVAGLMMTIASTLFWITGAVLNLGFSLASSSNYLWMMDQWFASAWNMLLGSSRSDFGSGFSILGISIVALILFAIVMTIWKARRSGPIKGLIIGSALIMVSLVIMGTQSSAQHDVSSSGRVNMDESEPDWSTDWTSYRIGSAGWVFGGAESAVMTISNLVTNGITSLSTAMVDSSEDDFPTQSGSCEAYVNGMHNLYTGVTSDNGISASIKTNAKFMVTFDQLYLTSFRAMYTTAAFGNSMSSANSWCRIADMQGNVPVGQIALTSMASGGGSYLTESSWLYRNIIGDLVTEDGAWRAEDLSDVGAQSASAIFGVGPAAGRTSGSTPFFFAACTWISPDDYGKGRSAHKALLSEAELNPEWYGVKLNNGSTITSSSCQLDGASLIAGDENSFDYTLTNEDYVWSFLSLMFTGDSNVGEWFSEAQSGEAYTYWSNIAGISFGVGMLVAGVILIIVSAMFFRNLFPLVLACIIGAFLGLAAMLAIPFAAVIAILPIRRLRRPLILLAMSVILSRFVEGLFGALIALNILFIVTINSGLRLIASHSPLTFMESHPFMEYLVTGAAILIGTMIIKVAMKKLFQIDMQSLRTATSSATKLSGAAFAHQVGADNAWNPNSKDFPFKTPPQRSDGSKSSGNVTKFTDAVKNLGRAGKDQFQSLIKRDNNDAKITSEGDAINPTNPGQNGDNANNSGTQQGTDSATKPDSTSPAMPNGREGFSTYDAQNALESGEAGYQGAPVVPLNGTPSGNGNVETGGTRRQRRLLALGAGNSHKALPIAPPAQVIPTAVAPGLAGAVSQNEGSLTQEQIESADRSIVDRSNEIYGTNMSEEEQERLAKSTPVDAAGFDEDKLIKMVQEDDGNWVSGISKETAPANSVEQSIQNFTDSNDVISLATADQEIGRSDAEALLTSATYFQDDRSIGQIDENGNLTRFVPTNDFLPSHTPNGDPLVEVGNGLALPLNELAQSNLYEGEDPNLVTVDQSILKRDESQPLIGEGTEQGAALDRLLGDIPGAAVSHSEMDSSADNTILDVVPVLNEEGQPIFDNNGDQVFEEIARPMTLDEIAERDMYRDLNESQPERRQTEKSETPNIQQVAPSGSPESQPNADVEVVDASTVQAQSISDTGVQAPEAQPNADVEDPQSGFIGAVSTAPASTVSGEDRSTQENIERNVQENVDRNIPQEDRIAGSPQDVNVSVEQESSGSNTANDVADAVTRANADLRESLSTDATDRERVEMPNTVNGDRVMQVEVTNAESVGDGVGRRIASEFPRPGSYDANRGEQDALRQFGDQVNRNFADLQQTVASSKPSSDTSMSASHNVTDSMTREIVDGINRANREMSSQMLSQMQDVLRPNSESVDKLGSDVRDLSKVTREAAESAASRWFQ